MADKKKKKKKKKKTRFLTVNQSTQRLTLKSLISIAADDKLILFRIRVEWGIFQRN